MKRKEILTVNELETKQTELTDEQKAAVEYIRANAWKGLVALAGPAGSGKTTVIKSLVDVLRQPVLASAMTNKAACVLRKKGIDAVTFHQACMAPIFKPPLHDIARFLNEADEKKVKYPEELKAEYSEEELFKALLATRRTGINSGMRALGITNIFSYISGWIAAGKKEGTLIVDEASMLGDRELEIAQEVFDCVILIGDTHQLPPVKSSPVFWEVENRIELTKIHRQAEGSQPLQIATKIRMGQMVPMSPRKNIDYELCKAGMPVICWKNVTRTRLTNEIRKALGYEGLPPQEGEYLICRNTQDKDAKLRGLFNNSIWRVVNSIDWVCTLESDDGEILNGEHVFDEDAQVGDGVPYRFAYCLTAHSSQGSEWESIQIHAPDASAVLNFKKDEGAKWLYTAVTRAKGELRWVI